MHGLIGMAGTLGILLLLGALCGCLDKMNQMGY
jgi:hypothetical protein